MKNIFLICFCILLPNVLKAESTLCRFSSTIYGTSFKFENDVKVSCRNYKNTYTKSNIIPVAFRIKNGTATKTISNSKERLTLAQILTKYPDEELTDLELSDGVLLFPDEHETNVRKAETLDKTTDKGFREINCEWVSAPAVVSYPSSCNTKNDKVCVGTTKCDYVGRKGERTLSGVTTLQSCPAMDKGCPSAQNCVTAKSITGFRVEEEAIYKYNQESIKTLQNKPVVCEPGMRLDDFKHCYRPAKCPDGVTIMEDVRECPKASKTNSAR